VFDVCVVSGNHSRVSCSGSSLAMHSHPTSIGR
jgi:hypothetical protein